MLSPHFSLVELTVTKVSEYADRNYLLATQEPILSNLKRLCHDVLEPVREIFGNRAMFITSGYRCHDLNEAVGGAPNSQHLHGQAADFNVDGLFDRQWDVMVRVATWGWETPEKPRFHQLLIERGCIHISTPTGVLDGEVAYYDVPTKTKRVIRQGRTFGVA